MFTGIVEVVGQVVAVEPRGEVHRIEIGVDPKFLEGVDPGASIAVDGACLTPVEVGASGFTVEAIGTTRARTIAGGYAPGSWVNLERALLLGSRLDGHLVQGHVDGIGTLKELREDDGFHRLTFTIPRGVHRQTLPQGSITLNGVSLTVNRLMGEAEVEVGIIPHTWEHTNFRYLQAGFSVNVEGDLIGKYVGRLLRSGFSELGDAPELGDEERPRHGV